MNAPVGAPNTCPVPVLSTRGSSISPKMTSLVPSDTATRPSRTRPVPIRLHGLSPDHATTRAGGKPWRCCQYGDSVPAMVHAGRTTGSRSRRPGAVARHRRLPPVSGRQIHQVHAGAVARIERRVSAGEQRRHERAHQVNAAGRVVRGGIGLEELADLRPREPLERARAGVLAERTRAADGVGDLAALGAGARIHPDRRFLARQHRRHLPGERLRGIERADCRRGAAVEIHAAVLLRRAADGRDAADVEAARRDPAEHHVERFRPHHRRRHRHVGLRARQHAVPGAVVRQRLVEDQRRFVDDRRCCRCR